MRCAVSQCRNYPLKTRKFSQQGICAPVTYHKFPTNEVLRRLWIKACKRNKQFFLATPENNLRICSDHFKAGDFLRNLCVELMNVKKRRTLKPSAIPSLKLPQVQRNFSTIDGEQNELIITKEPVEKCEADKNRTTINQSVKPDQNGLEHSETERGMFASQLFQQSTDKAKFDGSEAERKAIVNKLLKDSPNAGCGQNIDSPLYFVTRNESLLLEPPTNALTNSNLPNGAKGCPEMVLALNKLGEYLLDVPATPPDIGSMTTLSNNCMEALKREKEYLEQRNVILEFNLTKTKHELDRAVELCRSRTAALNSTVQRLKREMQQSKTKKLTVEHVNLEVSEVLQTFLSETQIKVVLHGSKKARWTAAEIAMALKLQKISERAYIFLQKILNYPLPPLTLLDRYTSKSKLSDTSDESDDTDLDEQDFNADAADDDPTECVEYEIEISELQTSTD